MTQVLRHHAATLENLADQLHLRYRSTGDRRALRAHLIMEEFAELMVAMADRDEVQATHELADLDFVVNGTAVEFDLPLEEAFLEIHRANMTKHTIRGAQGNTTGDKGKGETFKKADIAAVVARHRDRGPCSACDGAGFKAQEFSTTIDLYETCSKCGGSGKELA